MSDDVGTALRFKVMFMCGERRWIIEETDYTKTKARLSKLIAHLLDNAPKFSLKRIIDHERDISETFSFELDLNVLEKEERVLFAVLICLPLELSPDDLISLALET